MASGTREGDARTRDALAREVYWAGADRSTAASSPTESVRVALEHLERMLRGDATQKAPWSDPGLRDGPRWKIRVKIWMHRVLRPVSRRYDRLAAHLAGLAVELADRLLDAEAEIRRTREEVAALERRLRTGRPDGAGETTPIAPPPVAQER